MVFFVRSFGFFRQQQTAFGNATRPEWNTMGMQKRVAGGGVLGPVEAVSWIDNGSLQMAVQD
jgi:hypothetical protein